MLQELPAKAILAAMAVTHQMVLPVAVAAQVLLVAMLVVHLVEPAAQEFLVQFPALLQHMAVAVVAVYSMPMVVQVRVVRAAAVMLQPAGQEQERQVLQIEAVAVVVEVILEASALVVVVPADQALLSSVTSGHSVAQAVP